ncbi:ROK family protein [Sphingobacterium sp. lm-10]|uniref:ROK family protein n=1 Tax=Sphingobacterium sp. lm-10 TaxID=2944904 RepID=UPI00201FF0DF|nr:ROK family protein [Sphingobacterium sp. lm-10]MCL7987847.1 ROK family protein [Sphingobacterium sp. lm-10]
MRCLSIDRGHSIAELSQLINKSIPNVTGEINCLMNSGLVIEQGLAPSTGGRRAQRFAMNVAQLPYVFSIAIDQYYTSFALLDISGHLVGTIHNQYNPLKDTESAYGQLLESCHRIMAKHNDKHICTIGVSMPGFIDSQTGTNNSYPISDSFHNLKQGLEIAFDIPVVIENDSAAIAMAEKSFGEQKSARDLLVVNLNWGVGLGIIIDGKLFKGHSGHAGEFSHIPLADTELLCSCGKRGCLEVSASLKVALAAVKQRMDRGEASSLRATYDQNDVISIDEFIYAVNSGDQLAVEEAQKIAGMLGKGIATLIHIINPEYIIISGRGAKMDAILLPEIQIAIQKYAIPRIARFTKIIISTMEHPQLIGTYAVAIQEFDFSTLTAHSLATILPNQ